MTRQIRSRRAVPVRPRPLYARVLGLQYITLSGSLCFLFFEGTIALGVLLALAELVSWWAVLVLPLAVAVMVKTNDIVAGALAGPAVAARRRGPTRQATPPRSVGRAVVRARI
ncbi:MAG TPA: hypothetical protein VFC00_27495 [Micromonosporaceae bacterium]|nr:hypothetical protein [Micromonosporaceae bacterium]